MCDLLDVVRREEPTQGLARAARSGFLHHASIQFVFVELYFPLPFLPPTHQAFMLLPADTDTDASTAAPSRTPTHRHTSTATSAATVVATAAAVGSPKVTDRGADRVVVGAPPPPSGPVPLSAVVDVEVAKHCLDAPGVPCRLALSSHGSRLSMLPCELHIHPVGGIGNPIFQAQVARAP